MISFHGQTDIGRRRSLNEDTIYAGDSLFIVCDGMGGHKAGEVASKLATDVIAAFVKRSGEDPEITWPYGFHRAVSFDGNRLRTAIKLANRAVFRKAASSEDYTGMGTTVAAVLMSRSRVPDGARPRRRQPHLPHPGRRDPRAHPRRLLGEPVVGGGREAGRHRQDVDETRPHQGAGGARTTWTSR